jgi:D-beta-D-heptose 7-phosphate kinase/D-beta-D-heptose 1-phosphate adenosyltransferase
MKLGDKKELLGILDRIAGAPVMVVGDLLLDRYTWGKVERISPEAPVPVVEVVRMEDRLGGAGNVVRNLTTIGAHPVAYGVIGDDAEGKLMLDLFAEAGADAGGVLVDPSRPTVLKTRVIAHTQQIVRIDREQKGEVSDSIAKQLTEAVLAGIPQAKGVILSDYGKGAVTKQMLNTLVEVYKRGELGLSSRALFVDPHPANYDNYKVMSIAKPNRKEAEAASGRKIDSVEDAFEVAELLLEKWNSEMMVITLGEGGMVLRQRGSTDGLHLETAAQEVFDVSGAGDTVTAVFTAALAVGASPVNAGVLANIAAGIVVSEIGTAAIKLDKLREQVSRWEL